jgi:hypothetical protein
MKEELVYLSIQYYIVTQFTNNPNVFVTSPSTSTAWNPLQKPSEQQPMEHDIILPSMYQNQQPQHDFPLNFGFQNVLPPSPVSSVLLPSPLPSFDDKSNNSKSSQRMSVQGINLTLPTQ